ncbi:MAG: hypothetical protein P4L53_12770 [Candidatus Obscuribacterales bacterium]|nr:hypothetical protein [Candidatus Obscuribacterales bacterium]
MTQPLLNQLFSDRSKLSRKICALTLSFLLTAIAHDNVGIAQAKDTKDTKDTKDAILKNTAPAVRLPSFANHPGHGCMPAGPPPFGFMSVPPGPPPLPMALPLAGVDLSDEQLEKLSQLNTAFMEQTGPSIFKLHSLEVQFRLALSGSNLNIDDLNALRSKIASQRVQVDTASGDYAIAQAQTLTPEQRHQVKLDLERFELGRVSGPHLGPHE